MSILIITNQSDITSDFIVRKLTALGVAFYRLNTDSQEKFGFIIILVVKFLAKQPKLDYFIRSPNQSPN